MDRTLKSLLRLYPVARNCKILSNYVTLLQLVPSTSRIYSTDFTDYTQLEDITLLTKRNRASSNTKIPYIPIKILEEVATNYTNMTVHDVVDTLSTLFRVSKGVKDVENIRKHVGFIRLCEVLNKDIRLMYTGDIIESLKVFTYFEVPTDNFLTQSLLQMIRVNIYEISLRDIIFIVFLLRKMKSTPLQETLLMALPLIFEIQLPTKLDSDDTLLLTWSLRFMSENNKNSKRYPMMQDIILNSLWNNMKYENNLDVRTVRSIFYSLCSCESRLSPIAFEVLSKIQNILTVNAKQLNVQDIIKILNQLVLVTVKNKQDGYKFYDESLVDACVSSALSSNINFASGIQLLKLLNDLNYAHIPLLEYLAAKCFEEPNLLKDAPYFKLSIFLEGFTNADYKPVFWDTIRDAILGNEVENRPFRRSMLKFALHLIALDCYSPKLLDKVFSQNIKSENEIMKNVYTRELLLLYQSVKTLYPMYNGSWPSQDMLEHATVAVNPATLPTLSARAALELALGGPQYVHNDVRTRLGHCIDHVIVMRKGGYPIAINTVRCTEINTIYVEDIQTPSESQIILIFNLPDVAYTVNSQRLKSTWLLKIKSAEALTKSNTIAINSTSWMKLPEHERVPYLMQAIRLKCEDLSVSTN